MSKDQSKESNNMQLWDAVCTTDPSTTKAVNQRGGFTAICAQTQRKKATEQWGPYGAAWGVKDLKWQLLEGELVLEAVFYYPGGEFELATDGKYRPADDCRKKVLTDLTTKALSMLGFNSDVFEGKFDDNKYVAEMEAKHKAKAPKQGDKTRAKVADPNDPLHVAAKPHKPAGEAKPITQGMVVNLVKECEERAMTDDQRHALSDKVCGVDSFKLIPADKFGDMKKAIASWHPADA